MTTPLVSVVIPTCGRPQYLPRAVESALTCQGDSVEVIIVPNGSDESWKQSLARWGNDARVRVSPITTPHGNIARNHGLSLAKGKYLRFLDDDDYLLPAAEQQLDTVITSKADICSGFVASQDMDGRTLGKTIFPCTDDFAIASLALTGFALPTGHIFKQSAIVGVTWDENINRLQDRAWLIDLASSHELSWDKFNHEVGVWYQHDSLRTSASGPTPSKHTCLIEKIFQMHSNLIMESRSSIERQSAIADALWAYAHRGFPYHPMYWNKVAKEALSIHMDSRPDVVFYNHKMVRMLPPIFWEWLLLPPRRATKYMRSLNARYSKHGYHRGV